MTSGAALLINFNFTPKLYCISEIIYISLRYHLHPLVSMSSFLKSSLNLMVLHKDPLSIQIFLQILCF